MKSYKLIIILKNLNKIELKGFEKFLYSPFFRIKPYTIPFFKEIKKYYPKFDKNFVMENIWNKVYNSNPYNETTVRKIMSLLAFYAEEYAVLTKAQSKIFQKKLDLIDFYTERNLFSLAEKSINDLKNSFDEDGNQAFNYQADLESKLVTLNVQSKTQKYAAPHVIVRTKWNILVFITTLLNDLIESYANYKRYNIKFENEEFVRLLKAWDFENYPGSSKTEEYHFYYLLISYVKKIILDKEDKYVLDLYKLYIDHEPFYGKMPTYGIPFSRNMLRIINLLSRGKPSYIKLQFFVNMEQVQRGFIHFHKGRFILRDYLNALLPAIFTANLEWAEQFADKFLSKLEPSQREEAKQLTEALLKYNRGNLLEAQKHCSMFKYKDQQTILIIKILMLKIQYELKNYEQSLSILDSYFHFLRENKNLTEDIIKMYTPFAKAYRMLLNCIFKGNTNEVYKVLNYLEDKIFFEKDWLIIKLNELLH